MRIIALLGLLTVTLAAMTGCQGAPAVSSTPSNDDDSLSVQACEQAKRAVSGYLKAPSSAKFPGCVFGMNEYEIRADATRNRWWVFGYVDSQNSFGAMLRTKWGVELNHGPEGWNSAKVTVE